MIIIEAVIRILLADRCDAASESHHSQQKWERLVSMARAKLKRIRRQYEQAGLKPAPTNKHRCDSQTMEVGRNARYKSRAGSRECRPARPGEIMETPVDGRCHEKERIKIAGKVSERKYRSTLGRYHNTLIEEAVEACFV